jgi:DNA replication protein DnaC
VTEATPIGQRLKTSIPKMLESKLVKARCAICDCGIGEIRVAKNAPDTKVGMCGSIFCKRMAAWSQMTKEQRIKMASSQGVGPYFNRNGLTSLKDLPCEGIEWDKSSYICGPVGTGKTWALSCIVCDSLSQGRTARLISWAWFRMEVRDSYRDGSDTTEKQLLKSCVSVDVLCLDDLGTGKESQAATDLVYLIIDKRYANGSITHISSNFVPDKIAETTDDRVARRILEMCKVTVLDEVIR